LEPEAAKFIVLVGHQGCWHEIVDVADLVFHNVQEHYWQKEIKSYLAQGVLRFKKDEACAHPEN
jgi:hypothetical protein